MYQGLRCSKGYQPFFQLQRWCISLASLSEFRNWLSDCFVSAAVDPHSWWSWAWSHPWKSFPVLSCNFQISHWIWCDTKNIRFRSEYQNFLAISNDWLFPQLYKKGPSGPFYAIYLVSIPLHHLQLMRPFASPRRRASTRQSLAAKAEPAASKPASCIKNFHSRMQDYKLSVHFVEKVSGTNISQVSLVTCAKGFSTRTPHSMYSTVQPLKSSKALVCTTTFNRLKDELLTIFITDPPKKIVSKLPTTFPVLVTGSPPIFCKVIRSALALNRTASAAARCVNCSSSWGRPMGDPSASKGASPPLGPTKKTRLPQLSPLWWVLDGWWVSGSQWFTFEVLLKISLTFLCVAFFFQPFPSSFQMSLIFGRTSSSSCAFVSIPLKHVACRLKAQAVAVSIVPNCSMKSIRTLHWKLSLHEEFLGDAVEPSIKCSLKRPVAYLAHPSLNFPANGEVRAMSP